MFCLSRFLLFSPIVLFSLLFAQTSNEVEITSEPSHHLALENEYVCVFKVEVAPHTSTLLHRHRHDYVFVSLGDSNISNEVEGKSPVEVKLADGEARFVGGNFAHLARNLSDRPFRNVTIEFLQDEKLRQTPSHWHDVPSEKTLPGVHIKALFVKDGVLVSETKMEPGAAIPTRHHDAPHLVVAVTNLQLRSETEDGQTATMSLQSGEAQWVRGGITHKVTNEGKEAARFVAVEF